MLCDFLSEVLHVDSSVIALNDNDFESCEDGTGGVGTMGGFGDQTDVSVSLIAASEILSDGE